MMFRLLLTALWLALIGYTANTIAHHGLNLFAIFFGDIAKMEWPGQFNLDFSCFLALSALWTAWRNGFSVSGLLLAAVAFLGGAAFLLVYLLILSLQPGANMCRIMLGHQASREMPDLA